jgi:hypothetical protein
VCANSLRIARADFEDRIIDALRDPVLTPENIQFTIDRALEIIEDRLADSGPVEADRKRLVEIEGELENLIGMAAKLGDLAEYARVIERLCAEKREVMLRLQSREPPPQVSPRALKARITEWVADLRAVFDRKQEDMRAALEELLAGSRLKVWPDAERGFRVEGMLELRPKTKAARPHMETGRLASVVAGARSDRLHTTEPPLVVRMQFSSQEMG